jgi:sporulation protein YlmC with PRC-barrel domain
MRKISILLSMLVLAAMILAACGGEETSTSIPTENVPPITAEVTGTSVSGTATEVPTEVNTTGTPGTPGVPVTGGTNAARLSNELDFTVWNQDGEQIGEVDDIILDLDNTRVAYVIVDTSGFGDLGDRKILVPWNSLQLQTGTGDTTGGQPNAFILQTDQDTFNNAPDFDLSSLPPMGQPAGSWDTDISSYWQNGGTGTGGTGLATATAGAGTGLATATTGTGSGTGTGLATATSGTGTGGTGLATATVGTGTGLATATAGTGTGTGTGTGAGTGTGTTALQGVVLASDVLGSTVTLGGQGTGTGTGGTGLATATAGTGTGLATATAGTGSGTGTGSATSTATTGTGGTGLATATAGTGTGTGTSEGTMAATIEDMILDPTTGDILYVVLNTNAGNEQLIPVPLSMFQWDGSTQGFVLTADTTMLQNAPSFPNGEFPDTTASGWNSEFDTYWQNNGSGSGSGSGAQATATP